MMGEVLKFNENANFSMSQEDEFENSFILTETAWDAKSSSSFPKSALKFGWTQTFMETSSPKWESE